MNTTLLIRGARVIDPASHTDHIADVYVDNGLLAAQAPDIDPATLPAGTDTLDAHGMMLLPGLVDTCFSLGSREGGYAGTVATETRAAAAGGITHLACMPDTQPVLDGSASVRMIQQKAEDAGFCRVFPLGAMTRQLDGELLTEMHALSEAGCIGFSNAGYPLHNALTLKRTLEYAATFDLPVFFRPEDHSLAAHGCAHDGALATRLGLPGIPAVAETVDLCRDLLLIEATGVRAHFHQISSAASLPLLKQAKQAGLRISADVCIHHLLLDDHSLTGFNAHCHIRPPLRSRDDRDALIEAVLDGTLDAITSQHLPRDLAAKSAPFPSTRPGISGAEHLLPLLLKLARQIEHADPTRQDPWPALVAAVTAAPARCLNLPVGQLQLNQPANLCLLHPTRSQPVRAEQMVSHGHNTPWLGSDLPGEVVLTLCEGRTRWLADSHPG